MKARARFYFSMKSSCRFYCASCYYILIIALILCAFSASVYLMCYSISLFSYLSDLVSRASYLVRLYAMFLFYYTLFMPSSLICRCIRVNSAYLFNLSCCLYYFCYSTSILRRRYITISEARFRVSSIFLTA